MKKPLISIIIPVYNVKNYLSKCIESVISQTYINIEIILVDDGSDDGSEKICEFYTKKDSRIKTIHKKNGGLSSARNKGLIHAKGLYVYFIDSDDWIESDTIYHLYNLLTQNESDIASGSLILSYEDNHKKNSIITSNLNTIDGKSAIKLLCTYDSNINLTIACNKLYKRSLFDNLLFDENKINEDTFIIYKLYSKSNTISFSNYPNYYYVQRKTSIMNSKIKSVAGLDGIEAYCNMYFFLEENKMNDCIKPFMRTFIKCYYQRMSLIDASIKKTERFLYIKRLCLTIYNKNKNYITLPLKIMYNFPKLTSKIKKHLPIKISY